MSEGQILYKKDENEIFFKDIYEIIPNIKKDTFFDIEEVETYKIIDN